MIPMALALGEGGEQTAPLGRAVIGGLVAATLTTLLILPAIFALVQGRAGTKSPSLDPGDPQSSHYHPEAAGTLVGQVSNLSGKWTGWNPVLQTGDTHVSPDPYRPVLLARSAGPRPGRRLRPQPGRLADARRGGADRQGRPPRGRRPEAQRRAAGPAGGL